MRREWTDNSDDVKHGSIPPCLPNLIDINIIMKTLVMLITLLSITLSLLIPMIILILSTLISFKSHRDQEKSSPFECGFDPKSTARIPFSLRFFLLAVIFLIFDIEIVLLIPSPLLPFSNFPPASIFSLIFFLLILLIGLLHEWHEGSLNWAL